MNPTPCVLRPKIRARDDGKAGMAPSPRLWAVVGLVGCARLAGGFFEVREGSKNDAKEGKDNKKALSCCRQGWRPFSSPSPGYPSLGCTPAEPNSVSPGIRSIAGA